MLINKCTEETESAETMGQWGQDVGISAVCLWLTFQKAIPPPQPNDNFRGAEPAQ